MCLKICIFKWYRQRMAPFTANVLKFSLRTFLIYLRFHTVSFFLISYMGAREFLLMSTWVFQLIPVTRLMNVSCSCLSNLTLYLPELEVRRFNYLMSPLPACLSLWRVKIDRHCESPDSDLLLRIMRTDDSMPCQWIFLVDCLLNSSLYRNLFLFVIFCAPSAAIRRWPCLDKSRRFNSSELRRARLFIENDGLVFRPSSWPKSITASPCWSSGSRWSRGCYTRFLEPERTRWTWLKI